LNLIIHMSSFRKKVLISYIVLFLVFIALLFPFAGRTVKRIVYESMQARAQELIAKIQSAADDQELVRQIRKLRPLIFHRVALINDEHKVLYDSHTRRLLGSKFSQEYVLNHPEVEQASLEGTGYYEGYSDILSHKFAYLATTFDFHGKNYIMRSAFPYRYVEELMHDFKLGFIGFAIVVLLLFTLMTMLIMHHFSSPIQQLISQIIPYQEGRTTDLPEIKLKNSRRSDDFGRLAATLNSLSAKIQNHINTLTRERNEKEAILESLIEGVIGVDEKMRISYANTMALKLLGRTKEEILFQHFSTTYQTKCQELLMNCQSEGKVMTDVMQVKRDGHKLFLNIVAAPKKLDGAILVLQDQSSHYKMLEMRREFVANASHELKTPITIIRGFAETLQDNPQLPEQTLSDITGRIVNNCEKMTRLIRNLLALSDVENMPASRLEDCDLIQIANICSNNLLQTRHQAQVQIVPASAGPFVLTGDPHLLELALNNLLDNAAKYSHSPAQITIGLSRNDDTIQLQVADRGIGIPPEDMGRIFERFYRVDKAHSRKVGGSGLGLSIVETIIEKHFGSISVQSIVGSGTTFSLTLPVNMHGAKAIRSF
jgi:two-component system phosphate regulon sensor histidine kinase PhoR